MLTRLITSLVLLVFTSVSAYVTYTLTSSLANDQIQLYIFSALGIGFDTLKCMLPAGILLASSAKAYSKAVILTLIFVALTSFSFYASSELFRQSTQRKISEATMQTISYKTLQSQLNNYQGSYDRLQKLNRITQANREYGKLIEDTAAKMTALIEEAQANTTQSIKDLLLNIVVSVLLEVAVIGCHICNSLRNTSTNTSAKARQHKQSTQATQIPTQHPTQSNCVDKCVEATQSPTHQPTQATQDATQSSTQSARVDITKEELRERILAGDIAPSARHINRQYNIGISTAQSVINQIKAQHNNTVVSIAS